MRSYQIIIGFSVAASVATLLAGAPETTMDWTFSTASNPSVVQPATANPYNAIGTAAIEFGRGTGYSPGRYLEHINPAFSERYGSATGMWDILNGGVTFGINMYQESQPLTLRFALTQFASGGGFPFSANVGFSLPGNPADHLLGVETIESTQAGFWLRSTYEWQSVDFGAGPITIILSSDPDGNGLLLDSLGFTVLGDLTPIPEPTVTQLGLVGLLAGAFARLRRKPA